MRILCKLFIFITSFFQYTYCQTLTSFSPVNATDGVTVTINGTGLNNTTQVTFGGTSAASFTKTSTSITAVVRGGSSGNVAVTIVNGSLTTTLTLTGFTYYSPASPSWPFSYLEQPECTDMTTPALNSSSCTKWPIINGGGLV